eukprot:IDg20474t1
MRKDTVLAGRNEACTENENLIVQESSGAVEEVANLHPRSEAVRAVQIRLGGQEIDAREGRGAHAVARRESEECARRSARYAVAHESVCALCAPADWGSGVGESGALEGSVSTCVVTMTLTAVCARNIICS